MSATIHESGATARTDQQTSQDIGSLLRVDTFDCPAEHAAAFEDRLSVIHGYFDTLPGCLYNRVAAATGESEDMVKFVTMVEWRDRASLAAAKAAVNAFYAQSQFDPAQFMAARGIRGNFGTYQALKI